MPNTVCRKMVINKFMFIFLSSMSQYHFVIGILICICKKTCYRISVIYTLKLYKVHIFKFKMLVSICKDIWKVAGYVWKFGRSKEKKTSMNYDHTNWHHDNEYCYFVIKFLLTFLFVHLNSKAFVCLFITRGPQALTVTWVSETLHWLLVKRAHICISTAPS